MRRFVLSSGSIVLFAAAIGPCGCGGGDTGPSSGTTTATTTTQVELPDPMDPLLGVQSTKTDTFVTSGVCNQCHLAGEATVMHDADGDDMSPAYLWRSSMMAFAAKDPYYLAVWSDARDQRPAAKDAIDAICTRCHAPAGSVEAANAGGSLHFDTIAKGADATGHLARDGVTCSLCHQIKGDNLGKPASYTGGFEVGDTRQMFGPHETPETQPMEFFVNYTPTYADHVTSSDLCATCHTVIVPLLDEQGSPTGKQFVEQAPFFEWQNSSFGSVTACGHCHLPTVGADGMPLKSPIAKYPDNLSSRSPFGQHSFEGGNAFMLSILADNIAWTGSEIEPAELFLAASRGEAHLRTAAEISIVDKVVESDALRLVVEVRNLTGHKLPTGYPGRRVWLHVTAKDAGGATVFESGAPADDGHIESDGQRVDLEGVLLPHLDEVGPGQAQIWEGVAVDANGKPSHRPLDQVAFGKDDRILPDAWSTFGPKADLTKPVGADGDGTFESGRDRVTFKIPNGGSVTKVDVELLYQTISRESASGLAVTPTPAAVRFSQMLAARPPKAIVMATTSM